ncbi:Trifunctional UDP-glucose 4,6-dehydratase/UDP-4-keto-6-deoxy-D-glucose 3,5-epimerase/UDP-4-keto-L-rhamnose-reductase RHM1 [Hibiscus syriacus]|uniref:Trifunctional UDP-glucose 4,6-dehydratase/UDP-4-keto-6-deoxy-D-glucose 3,5-epimerase/UDP-4-keto-L-rhamnose-reductase RHM1 n=1 Tax=Hibiscus syriacus TaxID=106335 RepID=A0A6A2WII4_HIBSY|nr:Trifunctional UDP-glucose 4,6-dehydratase/UDP-4-keto-6-deoxy-D-glucose 3,5-epimerase/UDP-4-keto-L-rhamnose-reductase RHM1 [Hibiscus syriacus]
MLVSSTKHNLLSRKSSLKFLIYDRTGWIGGLLGKLCEKQGIPFVYGKGRLEQCSQLLADFQTVKPTHVFNADSVIGKPNVDWCETHKTDTIRTNVVGTLTLADVEDILREFDNVCTLRGWMPTSSDLSRPGNFIAKITKHEKAIDIPNRMTLVDELLPISTKMAKRNLRGIWNFTNPGVVSANEILQMYKAYIDPTFN